MALAFEQFRMELSAAYVASVLYLIIFATIISMWVQNQYQGDTTPTRAAIIFAMEPVIAAIFAYVVRGEILGSVGLAGAAIILGGLFLSEFSDGIPYLKRAISS